MTGEVVGEEAAKKALEKDVFPWLNYKNLAHLAI